MLTNHSTFTAEAIIAARKNPEAFRAWYKYVETIAELTPPEGPITKEPSISLLRRAARFLRVILRYS